MKLKIKKALLKSKTILSKLFKNKTATVTIEPELNFEYVQGLVLSNMYMRMYETVYAGVKVFKQVNTKRDRHGNPKGKPITIYFINSLDTEFSDLNKLLRLIDKGKAK